MINLQLVIQKNTFNVLSSRCPFKEKRAQQCLPRFSWCTHGHHFGTCESLGSSPVKLSQAFHNPSICFNFYTSTERLTRLRAWLHEPGCFGVPRWLSARYYMRLASLVDGWCDKPRETRASLILVWQRANEPGWPGKHNYMEKSQLGLQGSQHRNTGISANRACPVVIYSKNPRIRTCFFRVWQNRFLYFGVLTGILA